MAAMFKLYQKKEKRQAHLCPLVLLSFRPRQLGHGEVSWEQTVAGRGGGLEWQEKVVVARKAPLLEEGLVWQAGGGGRWWHVGVVT